LVDLFEHITKILGQQCFKHAVVSDK